VGPLAPSLTHVPVPSHQPQPDVAAQSSQSSCIEHGSVHDEATQRQLAHDPTVGPLALPVEHVPVDSQKPQLASAVQSSQVEALVVQGSAGPS
jgi:hypothetical protein